VGIPFFHVGIGPYIGASIFMSMLVATIPSLKVRVGFRVQGSGFRVQGSGFRV